MGAYGYNAAEVNRFIGLFSCCVREFVQREDRTALKASLFDVLKRSELGWHCYYENLFSFLWEINGLITPEELGQRMKTIGNRPNLLHITGLSWLPLLAREELILQGRRDEAAAKDEEVMFIADFSGRLLKSYRNDGLWYGVEGNRDLSILPEKTVHFLAEGVQAISAENMSKVRRMMALLDLYGFVLHGEHRDGLFNHGPYQVRGYEQDQVMVVKEFNDLQNEYLDWAQTKIRLPYGNIAVAMILAGVDVTIDMWGTLITHPLAYAEHIVALGIYTRQGDNIGPVPFEEVEDILGKAQQAQVEIYKEVLQWSPERKTAYGSALFANHLKDFPVLAGNGQDAFKRLEEGFKQSVANHLQEVLEGESARVWAHMAKTERQIFSPLETGGG